MIGANDLGALYEHIEGQTMAGTLPPLDELGSQIQEKFDQVRHYVDAYVRGAEAIR